MSYRLKGLSAYVVEKPYDDVVQEGDIVHLPDDVAAALADYVREAEPEDMQGNEDETDDDGTDASGAMPESASLPKAITGLTNRMNSAIEKATRAALAGAKRKATSHFTSTPTVAATPKEPVFKGIGDMMRAQYKSARGDRRAYQKLLAYEEEVRVKAPLGSNEGTNSRNRSPGILPKNVAGLEWWSW